MPPVQDIEDAVGEDDLSTGALKAVDKLIYLRFRYEVFASHLLLLEMSQAVKTLCTLYPT
jgi:hypothetical protein